VLYDVLDTPVSPELLPATGEGRISQRTEDLVGPYELHDFFLYEVLRHGSNPRKVYRLARYALGEKYDDETILRWLKVLPALLCPAVQAQLSSRRTEGGLCGSEPAR